MSIVKVTDIWEANASPPHFQGLCILQRLFTNWPSIVPQKACILVNTPHCHC